MEKNLSLSIKVICSTANPNYVGKAVEQKEKFLFPLPVLYVLLIKDHSLLNCKAGIPHKQK